MQVDGAKVLVTGASSGISAALAPLLAEHGATMGLVARRAGRLAEVLEQCQRHAPASRLYVADLADTDAAEALALQAWDDMGGIVAAIEGDAFEAYLPDMKPIVAMKTGDIDGFMAGTVAFADEQRASREP